MREAGSLANSSGTPTSEVVLLQSPARPVPAIVADAGDDAVRRFLEFFAADIRNAHPRHAYVRAVGAFLDWCNTHDIGGLRQIAPLNVATYIEALTHQKSAATVKQ